MIKPLRSNKVDCRTAPTSMAVKNLSEVVDSCPLQLQVFSFCAIVKLFQTFFDSNNQTSDSWYDTIFFSFVPTPWFYNRKLPFWCFLIVKILQFPIFQEFWSEFQLENQPTSIFCLVTGGAGITYQSYLGIVAMDIIWTILKTATSGLECYSDGLSRF